MKSLIKNKKGQLAISGIQQLLAVVVIFGLIGIVGVIMGLIQTDVEAEVPNTSQAYANSQNASIAQGKIFGKLPLLGTIIILSLVLIVVLGVVGFFLSRSGGVARIS